METLVNHSPDSTTCTDNRCADVFACSEVNHESALSGMLVVSIVLFETNFSDLLECLVRIEQAYAVALRAGRLSGLKVVLADNSATPCLDEHALDRIRLVCPALTYLHGHGNIGYGAGNNLAQAQAAGASFRLVLNPDAFLEPDSLEKGLMALQQDEGAVMACPEGSTPDGMKAWLCKNHPSIFVLALRSIAPRCLRERFRYVLARYELQHLVQGPHPVRVPIGSGCCMLIRGKTFDAIQGFDPGFFLYFEDFDLSLRLGGRGAVLFVPEMRIMHKGGRAFRKGWHHRWLFAASAFRYFGKHGWRWF